MHTNEDFFRVFGHISVFFATLDFLVTTLLLRLVDKEKIEGISKISDRSTLQHKLKLLEKLAPHHVTSVDVLADAQALLPGAFKVSEERNRYTHDQWMFKSDEIPNGVIYRLRFDGLESWSLGFIQERLTIADLYAFLNEIGSLQFGFQDLVNRLPLKDAA